MAPLTKPEPPNAVDVEDFQRVAVNPHEIRNRKISRRVCLIRREEGSESTGFLVGPDLILTTAHALLGTTGIFADPDDVTILFDQFIWNQETGTRAWGTQCKLRHIPFTRQPDVLASSIKTDPKSEQRRAKPPGDDNGLDYVLVRLDQPVGLMYLPFSHRIRGWNDCSRADIPAVGKVRVVQHPLGGLQEVADGDIEPDYRDVRANGEIKSDDTGDPTFFRYHTSTLNGSSGSPICRDDDSNIVLGMHIGERSEDEQLGVSFQKIFQDLVKEGVELPAFPPGKAMMDRLFGKSAVERQRKPTKEEIEWFGDRLFDYQGRRNRTTTKRTTTVTVPAELPKPAMIAEQ